MSTITINQEVSVNIDELIEQLTSLQEKRITLDDLSKEIKILNEDLEREEKKYSSKKFHHQKNLPYLEKVEDEFKRIDEEIKEINERIITCEEKKKKIKTIKEFKAINNEIESLNQNKAIKENKLLDKAEDLEFKKEKMQKIEESLQETEENLKIKKEELNQVFEERKNDIKKMDAEKEKAEATLPPRVLNLFNRIYENKKQLAIVRAENNVCQGCFALLPLQVEVVLKEKEDLVFCPSCSRILFLNETVEEENNDDLSD